MWNKRIFAAFMALGLVAAACSSTGTSPSPSASGAASQPPASTGPSLAADQVFRVGATEPPTLDPQKATDSASILVLHQIVRPLLWFDKDLNLTTDGGLAAKYELSNGGKTLTFTLKDNLKYSNGDPIKASDFVYAIQRLADPRTAAGYSYLLGSGLMNLVGADAVLGLDPEKLPSDSELQTMLDAIGVSAPDDKTVVFQMTEATSYAPFIATYWTFAPTEKSWITSANATEAANYVSSGPFMLSEWDHNAKIVLKPNPNWVGAPPKLSEVDMTLYSDINLTYDAYRNDELDISTVPSANRAEVKADPTLSKQVVQGNVLATYYIGFDMRGAVDTPQATSIVGKSKALRHALTEAIDKQALVDTVNQGVGTPAGSMVPKGMFGYQPDIGLKYDVTQAKADLATALSDLGVTAADLSDGGKDALELGYNSGSGHEPIMEFLQAQWQQNLGIKVKLTGLEWKTYLARLDQQPFTMFRLGWSQDYPHPNNFLNDVFGCSADGKPGGNNETRWCNTQYNDLLRQAAGTLDTSAQLPLYNQAQEILVDEAPAIFLYWYGRFTLVKPWVLDLIPTAGDSNTGEYFYDKIQIAAH
jgi:oligopeptide transport system substrate-binding protein